LQNVLEVLFTFTVMFQIVKLICCFLLVFGQYFALNGQHTYAIKNFRTTDFNAHHQNWSIAHGADGTVYFGNSDGLLRYDGVDWRIFKLPNAGIIRALYVKGDNVYTGTNGEFGYWTTDVCHDMHYHSLTKQLAALSIANEEIWHIIAVGDQLFFQSFSMLFVLNGNDIRKIELPANVMFVQDIRGTPIVQVLNKGIFKIQNDLTLSLIPGSDFFNNSTVTGLLANPCDDDGLIVSTSHDGVFTLTKGFVSGWNQRLQVYFKTNQVNRLLLTHDEKIVVGTIRDGVVILDKCSNQAEYLNIKNGLINNTILALSEDKEGYLWIGMDRGIAVIDMDKSAQYYYDRFAELGTTYSIIKKDNYIYVGSNQGLYVSNQDKNMSHNSDKFQLIDGTQGQVWQVLNTPAGLLCGHNEGTFLVKNQRATKICDVTGGWFAEVLKSSKDIILQSTYTGLVVYELKKDELTFTRKIIGFEKPIKKFIAINDNEFWVSVINDGIYRITLDHELKKVINALRIDVSYGLSYSGTYDIMERNDTIWASGRSATYFYNVKSSCFDQLPPYTKNGTSSAEMTANKLNFLIRVIDSSRWIKVFRDHIIVMNGGTEIKRFDVKMNQDYHCVDHIGGGQVLLCLDEGYMSISINSLSSDVNAKGSFKIYSLEWNGETICVNSDFDQKVIFPYASESTLQVSFSDSQNTNNFNTTFYYTLNNDKPTEITNEGKLSLSQIVSGDYTLTIFDHKQNNKSTIRFHISPPWYLSWWANILFFFSLMGILYWIKIFQDNKHLKERESLAKENERLVREHQYELDNARLTADNFQKSQELANVAMNLIHKKQTLQDIKEDLIEIRKNEPLHFPAKEFKSLVDTINKNISGTEDENIFEHNFTEVHHDFIKSLKHDFPDLSPADIKLACYLRMNLLSKEIAPLFNISQRGIENKRYRLRAKMELSTDINLGDYFINY